MSRNVFVRGGPDGKEVRVDIGVLADQSYEAYVSPETSGPPVRLDALVMMIACHVWAEFDDELPLSPPSAAVDTPEFNIELLDQMAIALAKAAVSGEDKELSRTLRAMARVCRFWATGQSDVVGGEAFLAGLRLGNTHVFENKDRRRAQEVFARVQHAHRQRLSAVRKRVEADDERLCKFVDDLRAQGVKLTDAEIGRRFRADEGLPLVTTSNNEAKKIRRLRAAGRLKEDS